MSNDYFKNKLLKAKEMSDNQNKGDIEPDEKHSFNFTIENDSNVRYVSLSNLEDAPEEWNFYNPLNDNKMEELIDSIARNGILNPIIVWEIDNNPSNPKYMILSGHNRKKAYEILSEIDNSNKYNKIPALIKYKNEITEDEAREIIIDTNWVQRILSPMEKAKSIIEKYTVLQNKIKFDSKYHEHGKGRLRDNVAEEYNISGRQVERYRSLNNLITEVQDLVSENTISISAAYEIAKINKEIQLWIYENHKDKISAKYMRKLRTDMTLGEVQIIFNEVNESTNDAFINFKIPLNTYEKYNTLSETNKANLEKEIVKLINAYTI